VFQGDCATHVFTLTKVTEGAVDPFHWRSAYTSTPGCGCNTDTSAGEIQLDLICSALTAAQIPLPGCIEAPAYTWTDFARIYSCGPYFAKVIIEFPVYGSPVQSYYGVSLDELLQTWCCGVDFLAANPGHPVTWVFVTRVVITITQ